MPRTIGLTVTAVAVLATAAGPADAAPSFDRAYSLLADAESVERRLEEAREAGDNAKAAELLHQMERTYGEVRDAFRAAGAPGVGDRDVLGLYMAVLKVTRDYDLLAEALRQAVRLEPARPDLRVELGDTLRRWNNDQLVESKTAYEQAIALASADPLAARAHAGLGAVYWSLSLYEFAAEHFRNALEVDGQNTLARIGSAAIAARNGRVTEAASLLDAITSLDADQAQRLQEYVTKGLRDFEANRRLFADTAENHLAYSKLLIRGQRVFDAMLAVERSLELDPDNPVAWNMLGSIARQLGDGEKAREAFRKSLALNPDQPRTEAALQELEQTTP